MANWAKGDRAFLQRTGGYIACTVDRIALNGIVYVTYAGVEEPVAVSTDRLVK